MKLRALKILIHCAALWGMSAVASPVAAEFLVSRASGIYQHSNGTSKVFVGAKDAVQGIFVMDGPPIAPQEFSIDAPVLTDTKHVFIKFNAEAQPPRYSEVVINDTSYQIDGNLIIRLSDRTTVSIDNVSPYLTVFTRGLYPNSPNSILGFSGISEVVRVTGASAAVLTANQLGEESVNAIPSFHVVNNRLFQEEKEVAVRSVGTQIAVRHECLTPQSIYVYDRDLTELNAISSIDRRIEKFQRLVDLSHESSPLREHLILRVTPKFVLLLNYKSTEPRVMRSVAVRDMQQTVCSISALTKD